MSLSHQSVRVIVVAHYPVVVAGLRNLLQEDGLQIVADSGTLADGVAVASTCPADLVIVDPDSPQVSIRAIGAIGDACRARILVLTAQTDPTLYARAIELGASGVISKDQPRDMLIRAIQKVHAGELWLDRTRTASVLSHAMRRGRDPEVAKIESLTKREREIVTEVSEGLRNNVIAEQLFISEATVRNHLTSILGKLGLSDRFDLAVYAFRHDLAAPHGQGAAAGGTVHFNGSPPARAEAAEHHRSRRRKERE